ncbi:MAG: prepilin-type N-terminal cleavage/methylation domain-containing protein [bacterium]
MTRAANAHHVQAFTLIELLIVVAIIGILAAIAVPNFMNARMRAAVSRAEADMRNISTALEAYQLDHNAYPAWAGLYPCSLRYIPLTTPVGYMTSIPSDPFAEAAQVTHGDPGGWGEAYEYADEAWHYKQFGPNNRPHTWGTAWRMNSWGPDGENTYASYFYDSSNGLLSRGDIVRLGPRGKYYQEFFGKQRQGD